MATANMKDVKRRIKSVESTMQITKAMELVASSKLRRAKERALAVQPFFETLYDTMVDISKDSAFKSVYTQTKLSKTILMIVIAGDRGLAGGFNSNVIKLASARIKELEDSGEKVEVMAIGKKSVEFFEKRDYNVTDKYPHAAEGLDVLDVTSMTSDIIGRFRQEGIDRVEIAYTTFVSPITQQPVCVPVLPVDNLDNGDDKKQRSLTEYDPSPEEVFDSLVPQYLAGVIYAAIVDSYASEQAARRTAMESASDNANDMINHLSLLYNRARQAQITQEITEISVGSLRDD